MITVRRVPFGRWWFYRVYDGDKYIEIFDYWRNAMKFARRLGPVTYVK